MNAINALFIGFITIATITASFTGRMKELTDGSFEAAKGAVELSIGLIGIMALWLGLVRILEAGGLMHSLARLVKPVMKRLFPDVPEEHPAMGAMMLNISANMLGLGNAATPFGIKAMVELNKLNPFKGTATNAMCMFLAINTSSVALLPLGVIGVRAAAGSTQPANIFLPTLVATLASTIVGVTVALLIAKLDRKYLAEFEKGEVVNSEDEETEEVKEEDFSHLLTEPNSKLRVTAFILAFTFFGSFLYQLWVNKADLGEFILNNFLTHWLMPGLMFAMVVYGLNRGVKVYDAVCEGAKQGFEIAVRIIPFLVAILVAIKMFRASGAMGFLASKLEPITSLIGLPADVLPMAIVRPLSGSGAFGVMSSIINDAPDSYSSFVASTMMGSTETTFYVLAIYFGAVGVVKIRHAIVAALLADLTGVITSSLICKLLWPSLG